jgi:hypothetical protein
MRVPYVLLVLLAGCTSPVEVTRGECETFRELSCLPGCVPDRDCTETWRTAAELDVADTLESCIALCPITSCGAQSFFDCDCYAGCLEDAPRAVQDAIVAAVSCDSASVEACGP